MTTTQSEVSQLLGGNTDVASLVCSFLPNLEADFDGQFREAGKRCESLASRKWRNDRFPLRPSGLPLTEIFSSAMKLEGVGMDSVDMRELEILEGVVRIIGIERAGEGEERTCFGALLKVKVWVEEMPPRERLMVPG
jgi:hypothetical protein